MDPNATLDELRELAHAQLHQDADQGWADPDRMAELFEALDNWITSDGFLPNSWERQS